MAYIEWTDEIGTGVLTPSYPDGPARRFRSWTPTYQPVGPATFDLGTGRRREFRFRVDQLASFEIPGILPSQHALYLRFRDWALRGCPFFVYCEDQDSNVYECRLAQETEPEMEMTDATLLEYTVRVVARSITGTPMLCNYRGV
jgi:hypothetical protein